MGHLVAGAESEKIREMIKNTIIYLPNFAVSWSVIGIDLFHLSK